MFSTLNFGNPSELSPAERDPVHNIERNLHVLHALMGTQARDVVQVHQMHGTDTLIVRRGMPAHGVETTRADAIVTDDPARLLAIRTADCAPILLSSTDGRVVGAAHAGWRGVIGGVVVRAIEAMRSLGATSIVGVVGPCIGVGAFEVGPEVAARFTETFGPLAGMVTISKEARPRVDLGVALLHQLRAAGVSEVERVGGCTFTDPGLFFSHRRDGGRTGRMISMCGCVG